MDRSLDYLMCLKMTLRPSHSTTEFSPQFENLESYISDIQNHSNSDHSFVRSLRVSTMEKRRRREIVNRGKSIFGQTKWSDFYLGC